MAEARTSETKNYCEDLYRELSGMKSKLHEFAGQIERMQSPGKEVLGAHVPHLNDLIKTIDWKLEIFMKVCPFDVGEFAKDLESTVSVPAPEPMKEGEQIAGGDIGG